MKYWFNQPTLRTYADAAALFATARKPSDGKPLKNWCRIHKVGDTYEMRYGHTGDTLFKFNPDNTLEFVATPKILRLYAITLVSALHRAIPIVLSRLGVGRYGALHCLEYGNKYVIGDGCVGHDKFMRTTSYDMFEGMKFDLTTGECVNAKPPLTVSVDDVRRVEWLRALRRFKRGVKVRAKLGVLDQLCGVVVAERTKTSTWRKPDWFDKQCVDMLYNAIENNQYPTELLMGFVQTADVSYWRKEPPTTRKTLEAVDSVCDSLSVELRKRFGVFGDQHKE